MKIRPFTLFLFIVSLALILLVPFFLRSISGESPDEVPYKGIINLWNITDWRTGGSSCTSFLKKRIEEFESNNGYSFIEIKDMTVSAAGEALKNGEAPDMISYPLGFESGLELSPLPSVNTIFPQASNRAYPFMCGAYCMLINTDMLDQKGVLRPEGWGVTPRELTEIIKSGLSFDSEKGYSSLPAAALYRYPENESLSLPTSKEPEQPDLVLNVPDSDLSGGLDSFCNGKAGVLIASQRQLYEAKQLYDDNKAPSFASYALSGYTDMVQMIGVINCEDEKKLKVCSDFAQYLLRPSVQKKLEALGVFPVISKLEIYQTDESLYSIYDLLCKDGYLPLGEARQKVYDLSQKALTGDKGALSELRNIAGY